MFIRQLEIRGFKSFPHQTLFQFCEGISGVVGSNGCGKSNVVDAVKWCLGEQSARSLRGSQMEDVIFNGTEKRSALNTAEVAITLERGELPFAGDYAQFDQLRVARKMTRQGGSEYTINRARARLKDIQNLFLDTGLNNKNYAFIEQGQIGAIVSARPQDTRLLLEEAAGISRFKKHRALTVERMDLTKENLDRVSYFVDDLSSQQRKLKRQVRKALHQKRAESRFRQLTIALYFSQYRCLIDDRKAVSAELRDAQHREEQSKMIWERQRSLAYQKEQLVQRLNEEQELSKQKWKDLVEVLNQSNRERNEVQTSLAVRRDRVLGMRVRLDEETAQLEHVEQQLAQKKTIYQESQAQLLVSQRNLHEKEQELVTVTKSVNVLMDRTRVLSRNLRDVYQEQDRLMAQIEAAKHQEQQNRQDIEELELEQARNQIAQERLQGEALSVEAILSEILSEQQELRGKVTLLEEQVQAQMQKKNEHQLRLSEKKSQIVRLEVEVRHCEQRREKTERLLFQHEGLPDALKVILEDPRVLGVLAEQLEISSEHEGDAVALLGEDLYALILEDGAALAELQRKCPEGHSFRFILLSSETSNHGELEDPFLDGLVGTDLGRRALYQLFSHKKRLLFSQPDDLKLYFNQAVTEIGAEAYSIAPPFQLEASGLLRFGLSQTEIRSNLSLRRELREHQMRLKELQALQETARLEHQECIEQGAALSRAYQQIGVQLKEAKLLVEQKQNEVLQQKEQKAALGQELVMLQRERSRLAQQRQQRQETLTTILSEQNHKSVRLSELQIEHQSIDSELHTKRAQFEYEDQTKRHLENALKEKRAELSEQRASFSLLEQERTALLTQQSSHQEKIINFDTQIVEMDIFLQQAGAREQQLNGEIQAHNKEKEELEQVLDAIDQRVKQSQKELLQISTIFSELVKNREEATKLRVEVEHRLNGVKIEILSRREHLEQNYEFSPSMEASLLERRGFLLIPVSPQALETDFPEEEIPEQERHWLSDLRLVEAEVFDEQLQSLWEQERMTVEALLSALGEVNQMAPAEYQEVSKRLELLQNEQSDLNESLRQIEGSIAQLDQTCREKFSQTFNEVSRCFSEYYPRLVGGGKAKLELVDPSDLLGTGIRIYAQPPGKKLQSLSLLSGGEKAMVAIALLFSLFTVRPSPFCLLDEVDAPLDEGNGARFNAMLKEMAERSQFIVITHNKKTMEAADVLYGVSMEEQGVSKLVTVDLSS